MKNKIPVLITTDNTKRGVFMGFIDPKDADKEILERPNDMVNLGYHHLHESHLEFLKRIPNAWAQVVMIGGNAYARE